MNSLLIWLRVIVLAALLILVGPWALNATTPTAPVQPTRPAPADLDQQQRERTARFCERVIQAGFDSCKEIAHDGP